jgi:hypothetical protein
MLSKALIFVFTVLGVFALLMVYLPTELISTGWNPSYRRQDLEVKQVFSAAQLQVYDLNNATNITYPSSTLFPLTGGQQLEIWWSLYHSPSYWVKSLQIRHLTDMAFGFWIGYHTLTLYFQDGVTPVPLHGSGIPSDIEFEDLDDAYNSTSKSCAFVMKCDHVNAAFILGTAVGDADIYESWNTGTMQFYLSYSVNWTNTGYNAWSLVGQMLTFQAPDLGIGATGGVIVNSLIAIPLWSLIGYILYKIIAGIIPFISGGSGD